jgi:signal transduction histidine kinase
MPFLRVHAAPGDGLSVNSSGSFILLFAALGLLGLGLLAFRFCRSSLLRARLEAEDRARQALAAQMEDRQEAEDTLRRTLIMFQLLQDVTAAAGTARSVEEAMQNTLDIICSFTGWPVAHVFYPVLPPNAAPRLKPTGIWHLEDPHDFEAFLRAGELKVLGMGKGLPGKAWSSRRVVWSRFTDDPHSAAFFLKALAVGLAMGFAIPVFKNEELVAVLEFFSPPAPDPGDTVLNSLTGVGEQLGRMAERLQAEEELEKLNRRLVELNEEKNQFLGIASHDLKNPLNGIGLVGELLKSGDLAPEEVVEMGRRISSETQRATRLIQKLLDVTAIESGQFNLKFGQVSLGEALMQVQAKYRERAKAKGQVIALDFGGRDVLVWTDREYLQEVLCNLVSNALKFMAPGPPVRAVALRLDEDDAGGIVEIQDEGPGFSEEDKHRAFDRFSKLTARPTGGEDSTGLGLSIVRKLVESLHGRVELESQLGRGARFRLRFPLNASSAEIQ